AEGSTRIDGEIKGDVEVKGSLIVGSTGKIEGNTKADNVFLAGEIHGNIDSSEGKTEISDTGKVVGDITTKAIVIDENAVFDGKCSMTSKEGTTEGNTGNKEAKEQK
ncbi:MAG: polymer-forming cytoskeletal protein, partial [Lachnospiraceae bacterium]|nr:polymer-forming cytoskeletal protein [Lachnospiraceae bacterium]